MSRLLRRRTPPLLRRPCLRLSPRLLRRPGLDWLWRHTLPRVLLNGRLVRLRPHCVCRAGWSPLDLRDPGLELRDPPGQLDELALQLLLTAFPICHPLLLLKALLLAGPAELGRLPTFPTHKEHGRHPGLSALSHFGHLAWVEASVSRR